MSNNGQKKFRYFNTLVKLPDLLGPIKAPKLNCNERCECRYCKAVVCYNSYFATITIESPVGFCNIYIMEDHSLFIITECYGKTILSEINITDGGIIIEQVNMVSSNNNFSKNSVYGYFQKSNFAWIHYTGELPPKIKNLIFPKVPYYPKLEDIATLKNDNNKLQKKINTLQEEVNKLRSELNTLRTKPFKIWDPITNDNFDESWRRHYLGTELCQAVGI